MSDLFKKLNVLIKSSLNDMVSDPGSARRPAVAPHRLGKDIDREVSALRAKINEAVDYEAGLRARVVQLGDEMLRWDTQADDSVAAGREEDARYSIDQMKRAQQRLTMAENDLRDHQLVTQELIQRVNMLEAAVADARRAEQARETLPEPASVEPAEARAPGRMLSDVLRDAREKIAGMQNVIDAQDDLSPRPADRPADDQAIDDDLARRRQRLSK